MKEAIRQLVDFYKRAGIHVVAQGMIVYILKEQHKNYDKFRKNAKRLGETQSFQMKQCLFEQKGMKNFLQNN